MNTKDIHIYESGDGGDISIQNGDIVLVNSVYQTIYTTLFGGNIEASTTGEETESQQRFDWWANELLFPNDVVKQFNSETERCLNSIILNSSGRLKLISAINTDLSVVSDVIDFDVDVSILSSTRVSINIKCSNPDLNENTLVSFLWDGAINELIFNIKI